MPRLSRNQWTLQIEKIVLIPLQHEKKTPRRAHGTAGETVVGKSVSNTTQHIFCAVVLLTTT